MALSPEEREGIAEAERIRYQTQVKSGFGALKKLAGCFAIFLLVLIVGCAVLTLGVRH